MGHGLVVHTADCPVAMRQRLREPERWINVGWDTHTAKHLATRLDIVTRNERGVLAGWPPRSRPPTPTSSTSRCTTTRLPRCRCT